MDASRVDGGWRRAIRLLFPPRCLICRETGSNGADLCRSCTERLPWNASACPRCGVPMAAAGDCGDCLRKPPVLTRTQAVFVYGFPLDRLVPRFKFHRDLAAGRLMAELMAGTLSSAPRPDAIVPVPLHARRVRERGYDQALELARPLAARLALPLRPELLQRVQPTAPQSELDAVQRQRNVARAFAVPPQSAPPGHIVLLDDVMTTGATLHAAARALLGAGATRVDAWVCARVP
ncbi:competence protein ComF [Pseudoxanthomonas sp. Root65]|uniref:ComF family protein n=1 Tax=Pseudoxanthomonas sp. Root65 TaxID=1736576 RepID=UPI0006FE4A01|nr:ComF family protein [Pseudoxanthomonas sp. Root65]KRA54242.1 competence protein ComF [Pseudoxanthomonas sp. Root65]